MTDGLKDAHRAAIIALIAANDRVERAVLFGSRATGTNTATSDVDIALFGDRLTLTDQARLAAAVEEIPMAQSVDLLLYESIQDRTLREHIRSQGVEWFARPHRVGGHETFSKILGPANGGWSRVHLGGFVTLRRGHDLPATVRRPGSTPILGSFGVTGWHDESRAAGPGVTVGRSGASFGVATYSPVDYWPLNTALYVTDFHGNDPRFVYYFLRHFDFRSYNSGSAQPSLNRNFIHPLPVDVPPVAEQHAIAHILGMLDDKIELSRRMNETLEAMAQALFKSWFVDFDPVRAKMEGWDTCLPHDIADLFPDRLVESEVGESPDGWEVATLGDIAASRQKGVDPASEASDTPYIGLADMPRGSIALPHWGAAGSVSSRKSVFKAGDILFGKLRPYFHKVGIAPVDGLCSTDIVVLGARQPKWSALVLACVSSSAFVAHTSQTATGTKMPRTSWRAMRRYMLCRPTNNVASEFQRIVSPMLRRIVGNVHASRTLVALRDALLPQLISGKLRVQAAQEFIGSVG